MALHFVKTSVLTSSDGIDFGTEVQVESEETRKARQEAEVRYLYGIITSYFVSFRETYLYTDTLL